VSPAKYVAGLTSKLHALAQFGQPFGPDTLLMQREDA